MPGLDLITNSYLSLKIIQWFAGDSSDVLGTIASALLVLPLFIFNLISFSLLFISQFLSILARGILMYSLSPSFVGWSYTNPATNPIIEEGLKTTQSLANMILVLALVFIGLVTILGLENYNTKKLLISFFIVALLVNFAPVFCGIVVDASNILMNYFVVRIEPGLGGIGSLKKIYNDEFIGIEEIKDLWEKVAGLDIKNLFTIMLKHSILIIIYLLFALVYLLFAVLFFARYFFIWLLVILSPMAFTFYILPNTKHLADKWWSAFTQWAFIGVTAGFFLYLAETFAKLSAPPEARGGEIIPGFWDIFGINFGTNTPEEITNIIKTGVLWEETLIGGIMSGILPALFALFLTYIGFIMALSVNPVGAQQAINFGKRTGKGAMGVTKWAGSKTGATKLAGKGLSAVGNMQFPENKIGGAAAKTAWGVGNVLTLGGLYGLKKGTGRLGDHMQTKEIVGRQKKLKDAESKMAGLHREDPKFVESVANSTTASKEDRMAAAMVLANDGKLDKSNKNQVSAYKAAVKSGAFDTRKAENQSPDLVEYNKKALIETGEVNLDEQIREAKKKVLSRQSASQIAENLSKESFEDIDIVVDIPLNILANPRFSENISQDKMDEIKKFAELGSEKRKEFRRRIRQLKRDGKIAEAKELRDKLTAIDSL